MMNNRTSDAYVLNQSEVGAPDDFDFAIGTWRVTHTRIKDLLSGEDEWITFEGISSTKKVLGGFGNIEDNILHFPEAAFRAVAMRSYEASTKQWSIWWLDARCPTQIDVPVVGEFTNGVGLFYAEDIINNQPTKVRFTWDATKPESPQWEQAFSTDDGLTWKTNWRMLFSPMEKV